MELSKDQTKKSNAMVRPDLGLALAIIQNALLEVDLHAVGIATTDRASNDKMFRAYKGYLNKAREVLKEGDYTNLIKEEIEAGKRLFVYSDAPRLDPDYVEARLQERLGAIYDLIFNAIQTLVKEEQA